MTRRLIVLIVAGEFVFAAMATAWIWVRALPVSITVEGYLPDTLVGVAAAGILVVLNLVGLRHLPDYPAIRSLRVYFYGTVQPLFTKLRARDVLLISLAAGVGEELLFRGAIQSETGPVVASVVFGLAHMGERGAVTFGCWVMLMGGLLGWLAVWTGGVWAPSVAHAVYDAAALAYCRWLCPVKYVAPIRS